MLQQHSVSDLLIIVVDLSLEVISLQRQLRHTRDIIWVTALRRGPVSHDTSTQEGVEFLLIGDVSLEVDLPRVALLLTHSLHEGGLLNQSANLLLLLLKSN